MGIGRVIGSGIVGMLFLVPFAWLSFFALDLTGTVTGGLITGLNDLFASIGGPIGAILTFVGGMFIGLLLVILFPIHWALMYRPDDVMLLVGLVMPWVLACTVASAIFAHSPRGGLHTSLAVGIGYLILSFVLYGVLLFIIRAISGGMGGLVIDLIDGLSLGLTDLPFLAAVSLAILEGCLVGSVFGAFIGSLKYKPEGAKKPVKKKGKTPESEPKLDTSADYCTNCGAKITPGNEFCTNCGQKV
ncbi:MAG: zinc ribbon domain-containing protein [Promethearchaeati archaeon]